MAKHDFFCIPIGTTPRDLESGAQRTGSGFLPRGLPWKTNFTTFVSTTSRSCCCGYSPTLERELASTTPTTLLAT
jgi:hypothetical protein